MVKRILLSGSLVMLAIYLGYIGWHWAEGERLQMISDIKEIEKQGYITSAHPERYYILGFYPAAVAVAMALVCWPHKEGD